MWALAPGCNRNQHTHVAAHLKPDAHPPRSDLRRNAPNVRFTSTDSSLRTAKKICTVPCGSTTMHRMVTAPICTDSSNGITRAQSRAGEWTASFDFDVALNATSSYPNVIAPNESLADSSLSLRNSTGAFCCNQQYSVTAITTSTGAIAERYAYTAYGQPTILNASGTPLSPQTSTLNSRYSYTGREWDATLGLHHFRARRMSPVAGRFLGRDPIGYEGSEWGLFELMGSSPITNQDPQGTLYGNWCGPFRSGPAGPIDNLDAACQSHDRCLATWRQFIIPCNVLRCDLILCLKAMNPSICAGSPNPISCRAAQVIVAGQMCYPYGGTTPATYPWF